MYTKMHPELYFDIDEYSSAMEILYAVEKGKIYIWIFAGRRR